MRAPLKPHAQSGDTAVTRLEAEARRIGEGGLLLRFVLEGRIDALLLPPARPSLRTDELWKHSCFEAFVREPGDEAYHEFNFSPSSEWAAYRFDGYRSGMRDADTIGAPQLESRSDSGRYEMTVTLDLEAALAAGLPWQLNLTAVIEERSGRKSHWALAHPTGAPDFHHPGCFALQLQPATLP